MKKQSQTNCESCGNYVYDEEYNYYVCEADSGEDEMAGFLGDQNFQYSYYQLDDEYHTVQEQM